MRVERWSQFHYSRYYQILMLKREGENYKEEIRKLKEGRIV